MSPILNAKKAMERRLTTLVPVKNIAFEGVTFKPPNNQMYLAVQFRVNRPDDPVIGSKYYRERITFQVFICDVLNKGTANCITKAEEVRTLFDKGTYLEEGTSRIYITNTPNVQGVVVTADRLVVPVIIDLWVEVYKD